MSDPYRPPCFYPPLDAVTIVVSPYLVGAKAAVQFGDGPIYVSPAMHSLMVGATHDELRTLLENVTLCRVPALPFGFTFGATEMTVFGVPSGYGYASAMSARRERP